MIVTDWQARHGLTGVDYQTAFDELVGRGYRLVKVAGAEPYWDKDNDNPYGMRVRRMDAHGGWLATATDLLQFGLRVDGFASPPDILQAGTITTMTTASAANATYACGWGVDGAGTRQHNGLLPGTLSILQRTAAQREWAAVCNTGNVGSLILGEFLTAIAQVDALV